MKLRPIHALLALAVFLLLSSFYVIDQGEAGIPLRFGEAQAVASPGLHLKLPLIDSVATFSVRSEKRTYPKLSAYSKDIQAADMVVSVNYHLNPANVAGVYAQYGRDIEERALDPVVPARVEEVFGQYKAETIVGDRMALGVKLTEAIRNSLPAGLIVIESVQLEGVDFSNEFELAIEKSMKARAEVHTAQNQLERDKIEAEKKVVGATAEATAVKLRGEAEAATIEAKGKALRDNPNLATLIAVERWDGKLPQTQVPGSTLPFIGIK